MAQQMPQHLVVRMNARAQLRNRHIGTAVIAQPPKRLAERVALRELVRSVEQDAVPRQARRHRRVRRGIVMARMRSNLATDALVAAAAFSRPPA